MSEPVRNFKQIIRIKGTGDDAYPNPGTLMLWGDNWTLLDWIRQHTDYSKDTRTTPVDVDVLTRLHEYATGIANQNGRLDTAPKPLQGFTVTAPVQILEHNTGCWWERTITARIRDGSTIPVVLDHVYWNWITGTPMHIHLDGIQRIRVIEDKHHQREENN